MLLLYNSKRDTSTKLGLKKYLWKISRGKTEKSEEEAKLSNLLSCFLLSLLFFLPI